MTWTAVLRLAIRAVALAAWLAGCAGCAPPGPGAPAPGPQLAVVAKFEGRVDVIDLGTGRIVERHAVGRGPHEVVASRDGRHLYVSNYGNDVSDVGRTVSFVDRATSTVRHVPVAPFRNPHGLVVDADGETLWVTAQGPGAPNAVLALDRRTGAVRRAIETHQTYTHMLAAIPGGSRLANANITAGSVTFVDRSDGRTHTVATGAGAGDIAPSPDGRWLWIPNEDEDTLSVVDARHERVAATFRAGGPRPVRTEVTPDGREVWVTFFAEPRVAVFDAATHERIATIPLPDAPTEGTIGLLVSPDGRRAWVSHQHAARVYEIDVRTRRISRTLATGRGPDGMAWLP